jgi:hypothetical protein
MPTVGDDIIAARFKMPTLMATSSLNELSVAQALGGAIHRLLHCDCRNPKCSGGFGQMILDQDPHWGSLLDNLHVAFQHKRKDIGRKLMQAVAERLLGQ